MAHELPSARHLADFHGFFEKATLNKNGTCTIILTLPVEMKNHIIALSDNDGMAINVSMWETELPEGDEMLARALGLE